MTSTKFAAVTLTAVLGLSACGQEAPESPPSSEPTTSIEMTEETLEPLVEDTIHRVSVTVPEDWYETDPREGFHYQYLWEGNNWDDILAQDFTNNDFQFEGDFFVDLLDDSIESEATITVRDDSAELSDYPAIIVDIEYETGSFTSLTYVNVDGRLWEFTVNSLTPEGLERGESINATAEFTTE